MARIPITIYKNSFLASAVSIACTIMITLGILMIFAEVVAAIICAGIGVGCLFLAPIIAERKSFKLWVNDLEKKGVIEMLPTSRELCLKIYQSHPKKRTIKFIAKYNPSVAAELSSSLEK